MWNPVIMERNTKAWQHSHCDRHFTTRTPTTMTTHCTWNLREIMSNAYRNSSPQWTIVNKETHGTNPKSIPGKSPTTAKRALRPSFDSPPTATARSTQRVFHPSNTRHPIPHKKPPPLATTKRRFRKNPERILSHSRSRFSGARKSWGRFFLPMAET